MAEIPTLMTIGEFSALSRLSVRMLRHYDAHGVLVPAQVDATTGYRRYLPTQLADAADIRALRDVGFGVSAISALLATRGTAGWHHALSLQRTVLSEELAVARGRLTLIDHLLHEGETMSITVTRTTVDPMTAAGLRGTVPTYSDEGRLWAELTPRLEAAGLRPTGPCGVIEHDEEYTERDVDLEIFVPVAADTIVEAPLTLHHLPARDCVVAEVVGPYTQISSAWDAIGERLTADGLTPLRDGTVAGKGFNVYLTTLGQVPQEELVTRVHLPVR